MCTNACIQSSAQISNGHFCVQNIPNVYKYAALANRVPGDGLALSGAKASTTRLNRSLIFCVALALSRVQILFLPFPGFI